MVTGANTLGSSQTSGIDLSVKVSKTSISDKYTSEVYKADNNKTDSKTEKAKSEDFKDVLSSKSNSKNEEIQKTNNNNDTNTDDISKIEELKEKLKELEDSSKSENKDNNIEDILNQLLNLLNKLGIKEEDFKLEGLSEKISSENLINMLQGISEENKTSNNLNSIMEKLMELMKKDSVKDTLDTDSLKSIEKILSNLISKLADDNTEAGKGIKGSIKNLMSEISDVLENKQKQGERVLSLEDMLNKKYSQDSKENALGNENNKNANSEAGKSKETSKEEKFLNSLLDDNKDSSSNKINLFASRTQLNQNQSVETVRGLTINKATFTNDLIKDVKFMSTNTIKELTVKVNPGDIGEITIKLIQEDGVMKANLKANSKEATALLSQNLADIKKQLNEQNIKIADVNVELYQEDTTFFKEQGFGGQLSEEQRRSSNNNNSNVGNIGTINEEDSVDNGVTSSGNLEIFV